MKILNLLFIFFVCCAIAANATTIHHAVSFNTDLTVDTLAAPDGNVYTTLSLAGCFFPEEEGMPQLPVKTVKLIIPADSEPETVEITNEKAKVFSLNHPLFPVQKPVPISMDFKGNDFVLPDKSVYQSDDYYPQEQVSIVRTDYVRGNKIVIIEVNPVRYNPVEGQLEYFSTIDILLHLKSSDKKIKSAKVKNKKKYNDYLRLLVDNNTDVDEYSTIEEKNDTLNETNLKSASTITSLSVSCQYVVITSSALAPYFSNFIHWKKQKGIDIQLVTTEAIFQNYTGDLTSGIYDEAGKVRQFLYDAYCNGLEYALLGGDYTIVPIRYGTGSNNRWTLEVTDDYKIPTDLYFSDFDGDWDVDSDQYLGEMSDDDVDYGTEISVGRLLCSDGSQIQTWTNKLLLYEQNPGNGNTYYLKKAFYSQSDEMQMYDQARDIAGRFGSIFTTNTVFEEKYNGVTDYNSTGDPQFPLGAEVVAEMNSDYGFVSWFNHETPEDLVLQP
jgi:hypothetical protein